MYSLKVVQDLQILQNTEHLLPILLFIITGSLPDLDLNPDSPNEDIKNSEENIENVRAYLNRWKATTENQGNLSEFVIWHVNEPNVAFGWENFFL